MRWSRRKAELDAEIAAHMQMAIADRVARGEDPDEARGAVENEFGNTALVKDVAREAWGWMWLERLLQDVRYALRQMKNSPGFAATVVVTLALGIGAAVAMFTVVDKVMLRPLPYENAGRLVTLRELNTEGKGGSWGSPTYPDIQAWQEWNHSFSQISYYANKLGHNFLNNGHGSEAISVFNVSPKLFAMLGVQPRFGRDFRTYTESFAKSEDLSGMVLSDAAWRQMFGGDPSVLGESVKLNDETYTIVGVMPAGFRFPFEGGAVAQVWIPVQLGKEDMGRTYKSPNYQVIGRLKPDVKPTMAAAELDTLQKQIVKGYVDPEARKDRATVAVTPYASTFVDADTKHALEALLAASALLWLIACMNATNLLLARATARSRELAVRGALGAGRGRIVQQLVVEGLLLSGAATVLGTGLAWTAVKLLAHSLNRHLPLPVSAAPNVLLLLALLGLTLVSAVLASVWPALASAYAPIEPALKQGGQQSGANRQHKRVRSTLVIAEIAMSLTLLVACGLLLRTIYALRHVQLGFRTDHILVSNLAIPGYKFTGKDMTTDFYEPLLERVQHLPGVQAAGLITEVPLGKTFWVQLTLKTKDSKNVNALFKGVSPGIQQVYGFKMLRGRYFNAGDTPSSEPVVVVNRAFAQEYSPRQQDPGKALGKQLLGLKPGERHATIVGVLDDTRQAEVALLSQPEVIVCLSQITPQSGFYISIEGIAMDLAVRTARSPASIIPELREVMRQASPELAGSNITTMDQVVEDSFGSQTLARGCSKSLPARHCCCALPDCTACLLML